jgi:hypothetical protein
MKRVVPCHETVYNIMFEKTSGKGAKWFTSVMSCIVIVSIIFFCMSTMPVFSTPEQAPTFDVADDIFNLLFTVEFIVRCTVICFRPDVKKELFDFFMVVDFLAILPALIDWLAGKPLFEASAIIDPTAAAIFLVRTHAFVRRLPASFSMVAAHAAVLELLTSSLHSHNKRHSHGPSLSLLYLHEMPLTESSCLSLSRACVCSSCSVSSTRPSS